MEDKAERRKILDILRWSSLGGDLVAAAVFVLFADSVGDIAYLIAAALVVVGVVYFTLWRKLFKSSYAD